MNKAFRDAITNSVRASESDAESVLQLNGDQRGTCVVMSGSRKNMMAEFGCETVHDSPDPCPGLAVRAPDE